MIKISASIVIYHENKDTLKNVIESFLDIDLDKELTIVDNSCAPNLKAFVESFKDVKYIFSGKNIGFGSAHNLAFKHLDQKSDIHLIINPDTYFDGRDIKDFILWMIKETNISLAIPQVLNPDGTVQNVVRNIPTPLSLMKRKFHIDYDELAIKNNQISEIPFAHGCFMVFKTDTFRKLGGFDESFFMYMEDVDIFIRAKEFGKTVINPEHRVHHEHRKGSSKSFRLLLWHISSAIKFFIKYRKNIY